DVTGSGQQHLAAVVERRTIADHVEVIGMVKARESDILNAPFNGKIQRLIPEGSFVNIGDVVAEMETTDIEENLETYKVDVELRKSEMEQRIAEYQLQEEQNHLDLEGSRATVDYAKVVLQDAKRKFD